MTLTRKQKNVLLNIISGVLVATVIGLLCYAAATPGTRTVNVQRYEKINLGNDDGTVDHFCLGTTGIWMGPNSSDFAVLAGDPQCR